jgi:quinohemoprotein ethanol dehydrogenase
MRSDAKTGELLWEHDPDVDRAVGANACCDVVNRGVAVYDGKIYVGVIDGRLQALDAKTGDLVWEKVTVDQSKPYTITGAPRVVNGKVLIGNGGAELGVRGYISAYDAETGDKIWRFYTVPNPQNSQTVKRLMQPSNRSAMRPGVTKARGLPMAVAAPSGIRSSMTK